MTPYSPRQDTTRIEPRSGGFAVAMLVSFSLHVAAIAAMIYVSEADTETLPPTAIAVEIISMSPNPGGQENAGSPSSGSVAAPETESAESLPTAENVKSKAPQDTEKPTKRMDQISAPPELHIRKTEVVEPIPAEETQAVEVPRKRQIKPSENADAHPQSKRPTSNVDEPAIKTTLSFEAPPERPERQLPPNQPSPIKSPQRLVSPSDPSTRPLLPKSMVASDLPEFPELTGLAALVTESELVSAGLPPTSAGSGTAGLGSGVAGVLQGPRFQLGAPGNPLPEYPDRARRNGFEGRVVLAVQVSGDGKPLSVRVASSSGFGILDRAASRTIRRWQFLPVVGVENRHVAEVKVPITFKLTDG